VLDRIVDNSARFLLVMVASLLVMRFTEAWYWLALAMVIGSLAMWLRKERAAGFQVLTGTAGQDQDADQGQRDV
jgi:hypothetical protein